MALKNWIKKGPDWYRLKDKALVEVWIETHTPTRRGRKYYTVMHQYAGTGGRAEPLGDYSSYKDAHKAIMAHISGCNY